MVEASRKWGPTWTSIAFGCLLSLGLAGCPYAGDLENRGRFTALKDPPGPTNCDEPLPTPEAVGCPWEASLRNYCGKSFCHGTSIASAGLNLVQDPRLISRILEVPATHEANLCPGNVVCDPAAATCDTCNQCPGGDVLLSRANPDESWLLRKMAPFVPGTRTTNLGIGCGDAMPSFNTTGIQSYGEADKTCLIDFFTYIATLTPNPERWPCVIEPSDGGTDAGEAGAP